MNEIETLKHLTKKQHELTDLAERQRAAMTNNRLGKIKDAELRRLKAEHESTLKELKDVLDRLPLAKEAAKQAMSAAEQGRRTPTDVPSQQDNEIVYIDGNASLVQRDDGSLAVAVMQETLSQLGDTVLEADLRELDELSVTEQTRLLSGYRATRERR